MDEIIYEILNLNYLDVRKPSVWAQLWVVQQRFVSYSQDPDIRPTHPVLYSTHSTVTEFIHYIQFSYRVYTVHTAQIQSLYITHSTVLEFIQYIQFSNREYIQHGYRVYTVHTYGSYISFKQSSNLHLTHPGHTFNTKYIQYINSMHNSFTQLLFPGNLRIRKIKNKQS